MYVHVSVIEWFIIHENAILFPVQFCIYKPVYFPFSKKSPKPAF